uniref:MHC class I-like antigen recognition-like domain-containing protein n=1 Tax=Podarcis muralis TaxID=64176 RepID=A0A670HNZ3_PODMU
CKWGAIPAPLAKGEGLASLSLTWSSTSHSLRYFVTAVSEPGQGLPQFIDVGYVDDEQFVQYDSDTKEALPRVPWIRKVEKEDPQYWNRNTQTLQGTELVFRGNLEIAKNRYNQSGGEWKAGEEQSHTSSPPITFPPRARIAGRGLTCHSLLWLTQSKAFAWSMKQK